MPCQQRNETIRGEINVERALPLHAQYFGKLEFDGLADGLQAQAIRARKQFNQVVFSGGQKGSPEDFDPLR